MEIVLKEIEVNRLNLQPGDILSVKLQGELFTEEAEQSLKNQLQLLFPKNRVIVLTYPVDHTLTMEVLKEEAPASSCSVANYCNDCSCGKKEIALAMESTSQDEIEAAAAQAMDDFGPPENLFDPASQQWLMKDGKLTEAGMDILYKKAKGEK